MTNQHVLSGPEIIEADDLSNCDQISTANSDSPKSANSRYIKPDARRKIDQYLDEKKLEKELSALFYDY